MKNDQYVITGIMFVITIVVISSSTFVINRQEIIDAIKDVNIFKTIEKVYTSDVAFSQVFINIWSSLQFNNLFSSIKLYDDVEYGVLMQDADGSLYFPDAKVDVTKYVDIVKSFSDEVTKNGSKYVYIQAPDKILKDYSDSRLFEYNFSNENADNFLQGLKEKDVEYLDLREEIVKDKLDRSNMFYKSDHHWNTKTAFWAYQKIINLLKTNYNFDIDREGFYTNIENYNQITKEKCFIGSLGRRVGEAVTELDDYTFIEPRFETKYALYNGVVSLIEPIKQGNFQNTIKINSILNNKDNKTNRHSAYFEWDYGFLRVCNELIDNDYKILFIKDSYSLPLVAYLSTCISQIDMVDLRDTPKADVKKMIKDNNYDIVIQIYNTEVFNDTMFSY